MSLFRRRPAPATLIALLALFVAIGGTSYAAFVVTGRNVKDGSLTSADIQDGTLRSRDVKNGILSGDDVQPDSLTGAQIQESTLGEVPRAASVTTGNRAFATRIGQVDFPTSAGTPALATLDLPAGDYVVMAEGLVNNFSSDPAPSAVCILQADKDFKNSDAQFFKLPAYTLDRLSLLITHESTEPGRVVLACGDADQGGTQTNGARLVAIQVGSLGG